MTSRTIVETIASELAIKAVQTAGAVDLLNSGNTIPFIARYRKEATGGLDEVALRRIETRLTYLNNLSGRKKTVLSSIDGQGELTPELRSRIEAAATMQEVEDLYLPYRPKRRTRASVARQRGLEPLADQLMDLGQEAPEALAKSFLTDDVPTPEDALAGARDIVAERVSDDAGVRQLVREMTLEEGLLTCRLKKQAADPDGKYQVYHDFSAALDKISPHQMLAINRGDKEGVLRVKVDVSEDLIVGQVEDRYLRDQRSPQASQIRVAVEDSYQRLVAPAVEREIRVGLTDSSDEHAIHVFATNLIALLLQPPFREKVVMGIDPGYRTGCKVAVVDATGKYLASSTIFPHKPQQEWQRSITQLQAMVERFRVSVVAIGNGTASRESERLVAELIAARQEGLSGVGPGAAADLAYVIVNEAGASVYSASGLARQELPGLDVSMRGAVSIARRLQDPLAELVKIDPGSIGVGLYQHDVDQKKLQTTLDAVVEDAVNAVGVDANMASPALLQHVAGLGPKLSRNIVAHRDDHGPFGRRKELLEVKGLGPKAYEQAAGFLRVPESKNPLDRTAIHPESYHVVGDLLELAGLNLRMADFASRLQRFQSENDIAELASLLDVGVPTLQDIFGALIRPGRDPRDALPAPILRRDVLGMEDLKEGMVLTGTVRNVVDFGAFVDIGVKQDGLVHVSQMAERYVRNPHEIVSVGDVVKVKVLKLDHERGRIGLSMRL
ncbi:MAG: Tex family protein [Chloroflexota bacterium]|nr:Tex family protein [Chloroflexota bacterium]